MTQNDSKNTDRYNINTYRKGMGTGKKGEYLNVFGVNFAYPRGLKRRMFTEIKRRVMRH